MPEMKNSFLKIRTVFPATELGSVSLELNTSRDKVLAISKQGIQSGTRVAAVGSSEDRWVKACRDSSEEKFTDFLKQLEAV